MASATACRSCRSGLRTVSDLRCVQLECFSDIVYAYVYWCVLLPQHVPWHASQVASVKDACKAWVTARAVTVRDCLCAQNAAMYSPAGILMVSRVHLSGHLQAQLTQQTPCRPTAQRHVVVCLAQPEKADRDTIIDYERLEVAVPGPQRPVNELQQVKEGILFSWATLEGAAFFSRLATVFVFVFALFGGPIAYQTFDPTMQPAQWALAGSLGALLVTTVVTLRIYLGWSYVGERLLSATIEYEV